MKINEELSSNKQHTGFAKDIAFVALANIIAAALQFLRLPILTRWLDDTSLYGTWSLIWVTITLVSYIAALGLGVSTVRFLATETDKDKIRENFYSVLFTVLAAAAFFAFLLTITSGPFSSYILKDSSHSNLVKLASIMIATQCLSQICFAFFRTFRQMKFFAAFIAGKAIVETSLMVVFWIFGWDITGVIIAFIASGTLSILISLIIILRQIGFKFPRFTLINSYLKYGLPLIPATIILWIIHSSDRYMIGIFMEARDVGLYSGAYSLSNIIILFAGSLGMVLLPIISKLYDNGDLEQTRKYLKYSLKSIMMLSIPAAFGLSILATPLLRILTPDDYISGNTVIPYITSGLVVFAFYQICIYTIYLVKKNMWIVVLLSISAVLNILFNLLLIPYLGIIGAAVATLVSYGILGVITVLVSSRYLKFDINIVFMIKSVSASAIMSLIIWWLNPAGIGMIVLAVLLGIIIYLVTLFLLKGISRYEIKLFRTSISGIFKGSINKV